MFPRNRAQAGRNLGPVRQVSRARAAPAIGARGTLTWALVAAVAGSGLAGLEAWPLTGWRLFSERRQAVVMRLEARAVAPDGAEAPVPFGRLPHAYSGSVPVLAQMAGQRPAEREPVCRAWADATARLTGNPVAAVRVYRVADDLRDGSTSASLAWTCGQTDP